MSNLVLTAISTQWQPRRDRVLWAPVFFGCGIGLYFSLAHEPAAWLTASVFVGTAALWTAVHYFAQRFEYIAVICFLLALGFLCAQGRSMAVHAPVLDRPIAFVQVYGRVADISVLDDDADHGKRKVTLDHVVMEKRAPALTPVRIRLSSAHIPASVRPGDRITVLARLMPPSGPVAPDGFDFRRQAYFDQLGAVGFTMGHFAMVRAAQQTDGVWFAHIRQTISRHIATHMPHPESAVTAALLAGERASIPDSVNQDLIDSGLYHLLSISGLHVAIVCGVVFFVVRLLLALSPWLALHMPIKKYAAVAALAAGIFYTLLADAPVPTQRSMLTTGLVLLAVMLDRAALSLRTLAVAALIVMAVQPESVMGASFQLSFAAVLSMISFYEGVGRRMVTAERDASYIMRGFLYFAGIGVTTVLVSLATLPVVLHHFGRLQLLGVIANAIAIPLTSFIVMPAGMAAMLLMPLGLDGWFLKLAGWGVTGTLDTAHWVAHLPHAVMAWPSLPFAAYAVSGTGFLLLALWRGWFRFAGLGLMAVGLMIGFLMPRPVALIDGEGKFLSASGGGQIVYALKKPSPFVRRNWLALWGGAEANDGKPLKSGQMWQSGDASLVCDDSACRLQAGAARLSVLRSRSVLGEECAWAGLVIALDKAVMRDLPCAAPLVPFSDLRAGGGLAVYADGDGTLRLRPFRPKQFRPWS